MQLQEIKVDVSGGNMGESTAFSFEIGPKAFRIMSGDIYQDRRGSMVREICCNAYDSHVMAGKADVPFTVHMPDVYEPWFSVRDYGLGLSDSEAKTVLTTYLKSTKSDTNAVVGAFGLGSKTPFAYCNAFTVTSIKDGFRRVYSCFVGPAGVPDLAPMGDAVATDECNGVEVRVPVVKTDDFREFPRDVKSQLKFFDVKPEILNYGGTIDYIDYKSSMTSYMECENVFIGSVNSPLRGVWIVQGVIGYPMDVTLVGNAVSPLNREFLEVIKDRALLRFDIGDIEVTASREGVSYTDYTLANIEARLDAARTSIRSQLAAQFDAQPTPWDKACEVNGNQTLANLAKACEVGFEAPYYSGGKVYTNGKYTLDLKGLSYFNTNVASALLDDAEDEDESEDEVDASIGVKGNVSFKKWKYARKSRRSHNYKWQLSTDVVTHTHPKRGTVFIVRDTNIKPAIRLREYFENVSASTETEVYVIENGASATVELSDAVIATLTDRLNGATIIRMSSIALPTAAVRAKRDDYRLPTAYMFSDGDSYDNTREWGREYDKLKDLEEGGYYVKVSYHNIALEGASRLGFKLAADGKLDRPLYALRERDIAKVAGNPLWTPLAEVEAKMVSQWQNDKSLVNAYAILNRYNDSDFNQIDGQVRGILRTALKEGKLDRADRNAPLVRMFRAETVMQKLVNRINRRKTYTNHVINAFGIHGAPGASEVTARIEAGIKGIQKDVSNTLPLLSSVRFQWIHEEGQPSRHGMTDAMLAHVLSYCNLLGGSAK